MTTTTEANELIEFDPEYVHLRRYDFSVEKTCERYPDGVPDHIIAQGLLITVEDVEVIYQQAVTKLRELMGVQG
jgi:hypothetical protein